MTEIYKEKAEDLLMRLGVSPGLRCFHMLVDAIVLAAQAQGQLKGVTKHIYDKLANTYSMSTSSVARAVWDAVQQCLDAKGIDNVIALSGYMPNADRGYYTPKEFIGIAAIFVEREVRKHEG
jgi:hypothetical protein